jgi:uncharacterized damage-inducible protein DinB
MELFAEQYDWVRRTREVLFQYCEAMPPEVYTKEVDGFECGSIRDVHAHVAGCYRHWLGNVAMKKGMKQVNPNSIKTVQDMREAFKEVDQLVEEYLQQYEGQWDLEISRTVSWQDEPVLYTTLWLFTHPLTHEFHHKGQIVKMGRLLGYNPPDTDLIEPL